MLGVLIPDTDRREELLRLLLRRHLSRSTELLSSEGWMICPVLLSAHFYRRHPRGSVPRQERLDQLA